MSTELIPLLAVAALWPPASTLIFIALFEGGARLRSRRKTKAPARTPLRKD